MNHLFKKILLISLAALIMFTGCITTVTAEETNNIILTTATDETPQKHSVFYVIEDLYYEVKEMEEGSLVTISDYQPSGIDVDRWTSNDVQIVNNSFIMPNDNVILIAENYEPNSYAITYYLNGGDIEQDYQNFYHVGETYTLPTNVTKYNDTFVGWYTDPRYIGAKVYEIPATATGDKKFYAKYLADEKYAPSEIYDNLSTEPLDPVTLQPISKVTNTTEPTKPTATTSPLPIIGIIAGFTIAGLLFSRR